MNSIDAAIERANAASKGALSALSVLPEAPDDAIDLPSTGVVGSYAQTAPASLDGFLEAAAPLKVDHWLGAEAGNWTIGGKTISAKAIPEVIINFSDARPFYGIRIGKQNEKPRYFKTIKKDVCVKTGRPWGDVVREAALNGQNEYKGFDLVMRATSDIKDVDGDVVVKAGEVLGFTTAITNFYEPQALGLRLRDAGLLNTPAVVELKHVKKTNDKNPKGWGSIDFGEIKGSADQ